MQNLVLRLHLILSDGHGFDPGKETVAMSQLSPQIFSGRREPGPMFLCQSVEHSCYCTGSDLSLGSEVVLYAADFTLDPRNLP